VTASSLHSIAVVILAYGSSNRHARLADDALRQGVPASNVVIVHNPDRVPNVADVSAPEGAEVIRMATNGGYAAAMNRGIAAARRWAGVEGVVLLTHDVVLEPQTLAALHRTAAAHPDYAVLGPVLRQPSIRHGLSYGSAQRSDGSVGHITERPEGSEVIDVPCVDGSVLYVRRAALVNDAPLPERYFMYFEEAYLCSSLARRGWKTGSVPAATATSTPGGASRAAAYSYLYARNGLDWTRTFGPPGSGRAFARSQVRRVAANLRRARNVRASAAQLHGLLDQVRGRSGPPPRWVLRASDIAAVRAPC
jgi:GT2 family glycosyltransferase